jgi:hemolysin III
MDDGTRTAPRQVRGEFLADTIVHLLGLGAAVTGCILLAATLPPSAGVLPRAALGLYGAGLLAMLGCSALYNLTGAGPRKARLRRLDHAAIFMMIAGTYTPVALLGVGGATGWALVSAVWVGALGGAMLKLAAPRRFERAAILAYLLLGWAGLAALETLLTTLTPTDLALLLAGGLLYSLGVPLHLATRLPFHNASWHGFVVAAAACHYAVVLRLAAALS